MFTYLECIYCGVGYGAIQAKEFTDHIITDHPADMHETLTRAVMLAEEPTTDDLEEFLSELKGILYNG